MILLTIRLRKSEGVGSLGRNKEKDIDAER
jgi:hypothetical protein